MEIQGRIGLVTGAGSGIGRATARALAQAGARLVLCDVNAAALEALARELGSACVLAERVDVSDRAAMAAFAAAVHARVPAVDILVNNAGVGLAGNFLQTPLEDWDWLLGINQMGVIHGLHFFLPPMVARGAGGHVVNVSSLLGYWIGPGTSAYLTSKHAVFGLSESLREELRGTGIGVTTVCPGIIQTAITHEARYRNAADPVAFRDKVDAIYARRNYPPERVATAIAKAIRHNRGTLPVSPESWAMYYLHRLCPALSKAIARKLNANIMGKP